MRTTERIDPFIDKIIPEHIKNVILKVWELKEIEKELNEPNSELLQSIIDSKEIIREEWKQNPDLRFSQVLIQCGFPNFTGFWFYKEDSEILKELGIDVKINDFVK